MTVLQITCDNCGAKYKLPETFQGNQAKCQKCGSVIDVAKQRTPSAAAPGAAAPAAKPAAAAKPAVDRSQAPPAAAARPPKPAERPTRRGRGGDDGEDAASGKGERRGRGEKPAKKSNSMPWIAGGIGLVAVVVVVVLMMKGGDQTKPDTQQQAQQAPAPQKPAQPAPSQPAPEAPKPAAASDAPKDPPKEAAEAPKPAPTPPSQPAAPAEKDPNKPWLNMRNPPQAMDQVTDPKSYAEVRWPAGIDAAKQTEVRELAEAACQDGASGMRAANKLKTAANEYPALFAIVERLRLLDYRQSGDAMIGLALNKLLEEILFDLNARYAAVDAEENIVPAKAEWNTNTVKAWLGVLDRYPDADAFKSDRQKRKAKAAEKDK